MKKNACLKSTLAGGKLAISKRSEIQSQFSQGQRKEIVAASGWRLSLALLDENSKRKLISMLKRSPLTDISQLERFGRGQITTIKFNGDTRAFAAHQS